MKAILGSTPHIRWRRQQVAQLFPTTTCAQMAKELGVPRSVIENDCKMLGLRRDTVQRVQFHGGVPWDDAHVEILRLMRPVMPVRKIAELLGRAEESVVKKAYALGLKKEKQVKPKAPKPPSARALKESVAKPLPSPAKKGPPPMTAAQRATHEKLRITYKPEALPWKAQRMFAPMEGIPDLSYRGQKPAAALRN